MCEARNISSYQTTDMTREGKYQPNVGATSRLECALLTSYSDVILGSRIPLYLAFASIL